VLVSGTNVGGSLSVAGGAVESASCLLTDCVVCGSTVVVGGKGEDSVIINGTDFGRAVSIVTGFGADRLNGRNAARVSWVNVTQKPRLRSFTVTSLSASSTT